MPSGAMRFSDVLSKRLLVVPDYQRPYAWEQRQLQDLWDDLDLMGDGAKHYTGTLVIKEGDEVETDTGETLIRCDVVDGQQRATTCFILLDQLTRAFDQLATAGQEGAAERAALLRQAYGAIPLGGVLQPRLRLGKDFQDYWASVVLADGQQAHAHLRAAEQRLSDAAAFFRARLAELADGVSTEEAFSRLKELQRRVTNGLRFLVYEVEPESHAGEIFETLNARGRELSELDKIKNYLLFLAEALPGSKKDTVVAKINTAWSVIHEHMATTNANEDLLLRAHWLATKNPDARRWKGSATVKAHFQRDRFIPSTARLIPREFATADQGDLQDELVSEVLDYVDTLKMCALFTAEFLSPHAAYQAFGPQGDAARAAAGGLRRTGVTAVFRPLLFAARLQLQNDGTAYASLAQACERYAARVFLFAQRRSNAGQSSLYGLAHDLYRGARSIDEVVDRLDELTWYYANDELVRANFAPHVNWYARNGHKYFLYEYELAKAVKESDVRDFETYSGGSNRARTTEHVLPQNPDWSTDDWSAFKDEHEGLVNGIGNLSLTDDNSSYGRKPFLAKKGQQGQGSPACYADSKLVQERELASYDDWTPATLEKRRAALLDWALTRWQIERPADAAAVDLEIETEDEVVEDVEDARTNSTTDADEPAAGEMSNTP